MLSVTGQQAQENWGCPGVHREETDWSQEYSRCISRSKMPARSARAAVLNVPKPLSVKQVLAFEEIQWSHSPGTVVS